MNKSERSTVLKYFTDFLRGMFRDVDFKNRLTIEGDLDKWRSDILDVWKQKKGKTAKMYSLYFDGEFVVAFNDSERADKIKKTFLEGFMALYEEKKIFLHKESYKVEEKRMKAIEKAKKEAITKQRKEDFKKLSKEEKHIANAVTTT